MLVLKALIFSDRTGTSRRYTRFSRLSPGALATFVALLAGPLSPAEAAEPSVIELFTSQGCSSCPPADRLLGELSQRSEIIALSLPVDYWDYIGWKDTLASPRFSARQRAYAASHAHHRVYTPQAIVNGETEAIGSDRDALDQAIASSRNGREGKAAPIVLSDANGSLKIDVPAGAGAPANVMIMRVAHKAMVKIGRGENAGNVVTYTNVVRAMNVLGEWDGQAKSYVIPEIKGDGEGYVILLQKGSPDLPGTILAAAKTPGL